MTNLDFFWFMEYKILGYDYESHDVVGYNNPFS